MHRVGIALSVLVALGFVVFLSSPAWAIWHFPSRAPDFGDLLPLALAVGGVVTMEAAFVQGLVQGSPRGWSRAYFLAASSIAIMIVVGEFLVPAGTAGLGRAVWTAVVNFVVQATVLRWAFAALPVGFFKADAQPNLATMGRVLLIPSVLPALLPLLLPAIYS